jgi:hypothetical protein
VSDRRPTAPTFLPVDGSLAVEEEDVVSSLEAEDGLEAIAHRSGVLVAQRPEPRPAPWLAARVEVLSVPELVTVIVEARHTGVLEVWDPTGRRRLFFEKGSYTGAMSTHAADRLGEVMWREGRVSLDQLVIASANLEPGKRIGRIFIELGYIEQRELRGWLRQQAQAVFEAACLEPVGELLFIADDKHPNPVRFGAETDPIIDHVIQLWEECRHLERKIRPLDAIAKAVVPAPGGARSEAQEAILQLAASAKKTPLTRGQLLARSGLGRVHGLRALAKLLEGGFFEPVEVERESVPERPGRIHRLCDAVNLVCSTLVEVDSDADPVREYLFTTPSHLEAVLEPIDPDEPLDPAKLIDNAQDTEAGPIGLASGLVLLLDYCLFEARDALDDENMDALSAEIAALDVF